MFWRDCKQLIFDVLEGLHKNNKKSRGTKKSRNKKVEELRNFVQRKKYMRKSENFLHPNKKLNGE